MKKIALAAVFAFAAASAFAAGSSAAGSGEASAGAGVGAFATGGYTSSAVIGSYNAQQNGPGSSAGQYTAGNQGYADTSVTFGTTQTSNYATANSGSNNSNGYGNTTSQTTTNSTTTGMSVSNQSGSENFGSSAFEGAYGSNQSVTSTEGGGAVAATVGIEAVGGVGFGAEGGFNTSK
jgi:hypothetical protein